MLALANSCEYEVEYKGRSVIYHFLKDGEYNYTRKSSIAATIRDEAFEAAILEIISEMPLNTAANVTRIILEDWPEVTSLGYTKGTIYEYVRVRMRKWFGSAIGDNGSFEDLEDMNMRKGYIERKVWCRLDSVINVYIPMPEEQIDEFIELVQKHLKEIKKQEVKILADRDAGTITREECNEALGDLSFEKYTAAKREFHAKYDYYPICVPEYKLYE